MASRYDTDLLVAGVARRFARRWGDRDREAVVAGDRRITWRELDDRVTRLADALALRGIRHGDRVAIFLRNRPEYFEIVLALASLGAVAAPQSFRSSGHELAHGLEVTGAQLLFADETLDVGDVGIDVVRVGEGEYERLLESGERRNPERMPSEDDAFWLASTGGTTGPPKLVRVPHRVIVQMWLYMVVELEITRRDTMLLAGPLHHGLGFGFALQQLYVGGRLVVMRDFDAEEVLRLIDTEKATVLPAAPAILNMILAVPGRERFDVTSLRSIISAGSPLRSATKERLLEAFPSVELYEHYGATEAGFFTVLRPEDQLRKHGSCGVPFFGSDIRVLDDDGRDVASGEIGLVYKRGVIQGGGYHGDPQATAAMFRGPWCTVGDLGFLDEEGYLHLVDRQNDMIVTGGVNVYPAEIEDVIADIPGVQEVAVIGVPDETWGEAIKAYVVAAPGAVVTEGDVVAACRSRLASYKKPRAVALVADLPKSAAGKILKRDLREGEWAGQERRIG